MACVRGFLDSESRDLWFLYVFSFCFVVCQAILFCFVFFSRMPHCSLAYEIANGSIRPPPDAASLKATSYPSLLKPHPLDLPPAVTGEVNLPLTIARSDLDADDTKEQVILPLQSTRDAVLHRRRIGEESLSASADVSRASSALLSGEAFVVDKKQPLQRRCDCNSAVTCTDDGCVSRRVLILLSLLQPAMSQLFFFFFSVSLCRGRQVLVHEAHCPERGSYVSHLEMNAAAFRPQLDKNEVQAFRRTMSEVRWH